MGGVAEVSSTRNEASRSRLLGCSEAVTAQFKTFRHVKAPKAPKKGGRGKKIPAPRLHFEHQEKSPSRSDAPKLYDMFKIIRIPPFPMWGQQFQFQLPWNITAGSY